MLLAAARRFLVLLAAAGAATALGSLVFGLLLGAPAGRALSVGFYAVGSFLLVAGFFVGNRGPARPRGAGALPLLGARAVRWATREEQEQTISDSAIFVSLGFVLIALGLLADSRYGVF